MFIFASPMEIVENIEAFTHSELLKYTLQLQEIYQKNYFSMEKLKHELEQLKKLIFGAKHERFIPSAHPSQLLLELNVENNQTPVVVATEEITYRRKKAEGKKGKSVRMKLPADLPREVKVIEPTEDVSGMKRIGEVVTEELDMVPAHFFVRQYVRPKYARLEVEENLPTVVIGELPSRIVNKGIVGPGLLAQLIIDKYMDHLPLYRQIERFKRVGMEIPMSTMTDWNAAGAEALTPLYDCHRNLVLRSNYLQADETTTPVLDKDKKGKTHLGYYWVYRSPDDGLVIFDYRRGRSAVGPSEMLLNFKGYLQTDGYEVYEQIAKRSDIIHVGCMAHARRKFTEAIKNDEARAQHVLTEIQKLYAIERSADEEEISFDERKEIRQEKAIPILKELHEWMLDQYSQVLPRSVIGKAIFYSLNRWEQLTQYVHNGKLKIDNNLIENSIRPIAIGRKNYLFAGSHAAAQRSAMIYSLLATCKVHNVNPFEWLSDVFNKLPDYPINRIEELLPHRWKETISKNPLNIISETSKV